MSVLLKSKYIIVLLAALAVIATATAFSVSYAKWTGGDNAFNATVSVGEWTEETEPSDNKSQYENGIYCYDGNGKIKDVNIADDIIAAANQIIYVKSFSPGVTLGIRINTKATIWTYDDYGNAVPEERVIESEGSVTLAEPAVYALTINIFVFDDNLMTINVQRMPGSGYDGVHELI